MLCRLCMVDDNNYQKIEGAICDMLRAVLRKNCIEVNNPVLCSNCVIKLEKAFEFKTTCLRTQKILSLYGGSNNKIVYIRDNKLCLSPKNDSTLKLCRTCLKLIEQGFCSNLLTKYDILEKLTVYIPEMVISENETSLFCYKCSENFRIFSELLNDSNKTESIISNYCIENEVLHADELSLDVLLGKKVEDTQRLTEDTNIMKLLDGNQQLLLDLENDFESTYLNDSTEDSKKRIIKKIIEEDVDLFYKEIPDFDLHDSFSEESGVDSDYGNIFFRPQQRQLLLSDSEEEIQQKRIRESIEEEEISLRSSFETEESSLSPDTLSDRHFYECESQDEGKKDERELTSPNPFIFFNEYSRNDSQCSCDDNTIETTPQSTTKRKWCEKCKSKTTSGGGDSTPDDDDDEDVATKRPKKDGKKKCRKMYGIEFKDLWCTRCRWKKACSRFGNTKAVSRR